MKKTISFLMMASVLLCFASCGKSELDTETQGQEQGKEQEKKPGAIRTISGIFENDEEAKSDQTKTVLADNGKTPLWQAGDTIRILSDSGYENIILKNENLVRDGKTFEINTTKEHSGTLYAVYPASATTMTSMAGADGKITFNIPSKQKGTFASANICVAKGNDKDHFIFRNATAVLAFGQTASSYHVVTVTVKAANAIAGALTATFDDGYNVSINTSALTSRQIDATTVNAKGDTTAVDSVYVAVAPVETIANANCYYQKKNAYETASVKMGTKALKRNTIYNCPSMNRPVDPSDTTITVGSVKWAKNNLTMQGFKQIKDNIWAAHLDGATNKPIYIDIHGQHYTNNGVGSYPRVNFTSDPTQKSVKILTSNTESFIDTLILTGDFFLWADTKVLYDKMSLIYDDKTSTIAYVEFNYSSHQEAEPVEGKENLEFPIEVAPYYSGGSFSKYNSQDGLKVLQPEDDAAVQILGPESGWRIPTAEEFEVLKNSSYTVYDAEDKGLYVFKPNDLKKESRPKYRPAGLVEYRNDLTPEVRAEAVFYLPAVTDPTQPRVAGAICPYWTSSVGADGRAKYIHFYGMQGLPIWVAQERARQNPALIRPVHD